ncbi:MAG: hypothetical protein NZ898_16090 [Myxococcota bacterium]|nr:hypothetical protein [Myxococcota bacterium]
MREAAAARARATVWGVSLLAVAMGCQAPPPVPCGAAEGAAATCAQACGRLFRIGCRIGANEAECVATCLRAAGDGTVEDVSRYGRVLACYAAAADCRAVADCSLGCGPMGGPVPFRILDAGADREPMCVDDASEPDDEPSAARPVGVPSRVVGVACPADPDLVSFGLVAGTSYALTLSYDAPGASASLRVTDGAGVEIVAAPEGPTPRTVSFTAAATTTAFAWTVSTAGAGNYELQVGRP